GCRIQAGGSDQWGNITAGIDLGRRMLQQQLFGITAPLLLTSEGRKMGKTEKGSVWLDPDRTSPYAFYQYWMRVDDADVMRCIAFLTEIPRDEYDTLQQSVADEPHARAAQKRLAQWMTQFVHGDDGLRRAQHASKILFGGEFGGLSDQDLLEIFADVPNKEFARDALSSDGVWIVDALRESGLVKSSSEARRAIKEGSVVLNNRSKMDDANYRISADDLASESVVVIRKGKKNYALLRFV
ncbi:MAG: tyrosine--tRNA ligase, partial [Planctomycetota bacterium]